MAFVKADPAPLEAAGLRWLAAAGARVPEILLDDADRLVLQEIPHGRLDASGEEDLGRMLATMHSAGAAQFGTLPAPGQFVVGRCALESPESDDWNDFYLQHRCLPLAQRVGLHDVVSLVRVDAPVEPPARLHGDLWSGNVLAGRDGVPWFIYPAASGGIGVVDLAMLDLFGRIPARTVAAYEELTPLADGWRARLPLWQLFPLLVHAVMFGGSYLREAHDLAVRLADGRLV
jgi:fructosamine-3-kinase